MWGRLHRSGWFEDPRQWWERKNWEECGHPQQTYFLPGRQRGLEGGELARGNSWERRRLGLVSRGSLFPSELMGSEDEPQPRQSSQVSPGLQWLETLVSRSGRGDEQGLQILERNHFLAWVNCLLEGGMHPSALGRGRGDNRSRTFHVSQWHVFCGLFLENLWRVGVALGGTKRRWGTSSCRT